jgi:Abortive infection alpha
MVGCDVMARKKSKSRASATATAKIEAVAKASYVRKRTTAEVIPPDVTRAKSSAWLDLISPITEWAGLKGDALRFQRTQLRLQREDVLADIVIRARDKIENIKQIDKPIPNKFLVPFLEQASLESSDSSLIDMWSSLLASAAENFSSHHTHFVSIISQLSPKQGDLLKLLVGTESAVALESAMDSVRAVFQSHEIRREIGQQIQKSGGTDDDFSKTIETFFNAIGISVVHVSAENLLTKSYYEMSLDLQYFVYRDEDEVDYSILEAVGLIRRVETGFFDAGNYNVSVIYYHLTDLGFYFCKACGIVHSDQASS